MMILAAGTSGTILATVVAFLVISLAINQCTPFCKTKTITIRTCKNPYQW